MKTFIAINPNYVNINDLLNANKEGSIVRCIGNPNDVIKVFPEVKYRPLYSKLKRKKFKIKVL